MLLHEPKIGTGNGNVPNRGPAKAAKGKLRQQRSMCGKSCAFFRGSPGIGQLLLGLYAKCANDKKPLPLGASKPHKHAPELRSHGYTRMKRIQSLKHCTTY